MNVMGMLQNSIWSLVDWIYPPLCLSCKQPILDSQQRICQYCWDSIPKIKKTSMESLWLIREKVGNIYFEDFYSCFLFNETIQQIIHSLKYERMTKLAGEIIEKTAPNILENKKIAECDLIIPVPLHNKRYKNRGYNQSELLAKELASYLKKPMVNQVLQRIKDTKSQTKLDATERELNMKHAFEVNNEHFIRDTKILLLDDLITTGVTANECAKELKSAGVKEILVFTIARPI